MTATQSTESLFRPFRLSNVELANRIVMAPMTRSHSPEGVPGVDVAAYYRRRAEGGVGLIITEGTYVPHPASGFDAKVPHMFGDDAVGGWSRVVGEVHRAGSRIFCQLWHVGMLGSPGPEASNDVRPIGPSGLTKPGECTTPPMTEADIDAAIEAYAQGAQNAKQAGFDGVELHGAHGYLIDQFFWEGTNQRTDEYGGDLRKRTRFAADTIQEVRRRVGLDFPVVLRFSQWKLQDYDAKLARTPDELEQLLRPLAEAGVDAFHCSTRRFWEPEFAGSDLNLAGWTKRLTGKPTITVGSITLDQDVVTTFRSTDTAAATGIEELLRRLDRGDFDLVAIGRSLIVNPSWAATIRQGALKELRPFKRDALATLI